MSKQKIVVVGGNGFVGKHLVRILSELPFQVTVIDTSDSAIQLDKVDYIVSDVNKIPNQVLESLLRDSIVVQLSALSSSSLCESSPSLALDVNIDINFKLIEVGNKVKSKIIFSSSEWVYPNLTFAANQTEEEVIVLTSETNFYTMTKTVGEWLFERYCTNYQILRFGIVYGERPEPQSAIEKIVRDAVQNSKVEVGSWHTARRFIHVEDVCSGIVECIFRETRSRLLNLAGSELLSLGDIALITESILGHKIEKHDLGQEPSIRNPVPELFYTEYKWAPKVTIHAGIARLVKLYGEIDGGLR